MAGGTIGMSQNEQRVIVTVYFDIYQIQKVP